VNKKIEAGLTHELCPLRQNRVVIHRGGARMDLFWSLILMGTRRNVLNKITDVLYFNSMME
jgi:hypothetical protein